MDRMASKDQPEQGHKHVYSHRDKEDVAEPSPPSRGSTCQTSNEQRDRDLDQTDGLVEGNLAKDPYHCANLVLVICYFPRIESCTADIKADRLGDGIGKSKYLSKLWSTLSTIRCPPRRLQLTAATSIVQSSQPNCICFFRARSRSRTVVGKRIDNMTTMRLI